MLPLSVRPSPSASGVCNLFKFIRRGYPICEAFLMIIYYMCFCGELRKISELVGWKIDLILSYKIWYIKQWKRMWHPIFRTFVWKPERVKKKKSSLCGIRHFSLDTYQFRILLLEQITIINHYISFWEDITRKSFRSVVFRNIDSFLIPALAFLISHESKNVYVK